MNNLFYILIFVLFPCAITPNDLQYTEFGKEFTKSYEGLHKVRPDGLIESYLDPIGIPTIGYGTTKNIQLGYVITEDRADFYFDRDLIRKEIYLNNLKLPPLEQQQYDALIDHIYNVGSVYGGLLDAVQTGNHNLAGFKLTLYVKAGGRTLRGLVRRAKFRAEIYTIGHYILNSGDTLKPEQVLKIEMQNNCFIKQEGRDVS